MRKRKKKKSFLKVRIFLVAAFLTGLFAVILLRAVQLQVVERQTLAALAAGQHTRTVNIEPRRGVIYDRQMRELAVSLDVDSVYARPPFVESPRRTARKLARILGMKASVIERKLRSKKNFVWIRRQVDLGEKARKTVMAMEGLGTVKEKRRYYPNRTLASNLLGFTGIDSVGLEGVELYYNDFLDGRAMRVVGGRDARGRLIMFDESVGLKPEEGMRVELTIDRTIQYIAEKALAGAVEMSGARGGTVVVMSPSTGEILAMASLPTFDPNRFNRYPAASRRNRPVTDVFEPGSVLKVFLTAGALEEGVVGPNDIFYCENGSYRVADRVIHDAEKHGWLSVAHIIKYSSNIGALKIGERLGPERLYRYLRAFGFGSPTGIDLPGESSGLLRDYRKWSGVTLQTVSFGQGVAVTAVQLVNAISAVANGGFVMRPYIVRAIRDADGMVVKENRPVIVRRVISGETARKVTRMLVSVTEPGGTGAAAAMEGFHVAGKTATAQKPDTVRGGYRKDAYVASFLGFVPASRPALAILVAIDEPAGKKYHGGTVAAPAFREIAEKSLAYLGILPERQGPRVVLAGTAAGERKRTPVSVRKGGVPDFRGSTMRRALRLAVERAIRLKVFGEGVAYRQSPAPGTKARDGRTVTVWFH